MAGGQHDAPVRVEKRLFSPRQGRAIIPFLMDVSPGWDAHLVFPNSLKYGLTTEWLCQVVQMTGDYGRAGMAFNAWNGCGESLVVVPTREYGSLFHDWLRSLQCADVFAQKPNAALPRNGTWACPYMLAEAVQNVRGNGAIGLLPTTSVPFGAPVWIEKPCTIVCIGGSASIGQ